MRRRWSDDPSGKAEFDTWEPAALSLEAARGGLVEHAGGLIVTLQHESYVRGNTAARSFRGICGRFASGRTTLID